MTETWLGWCERILGPAWKQGDPGIPSVPLSLIEGDVKHSAEGSYTALLGEIQHPTRQASWTFSMREDGHTTQHYPLESITWHCGRVGDAHTETDVIGNVTLKGIEHAGRKGTPLTNEQVAATIRLTQDIRRLTFAGTRPPELAVNLWEHNWISGVTSCPSDRVPWPRILAGLIEEEEHMGLTPDQAAKLDEMFAKVTDLWMFREQVRIEHAAIIAGSVSAQPSAAAQAIIDALIKKLED